MKIENECCQTLMQGNELWQQVDPEALRIPEISSGFLKAAWSNVNFPMAMPDGSADLTDMRREAVKRMGLDPALRQIPVWYHASLKKAGNHCVTVRFSVKAAGRVTLFANHRQMVFTKLYDVPCDDEVSFIVHMGGIIPRGMTTPKIHTALDLCLMGEACLTEVTVEGSTAPTIFLMGDSTVTDQSAEVPWSPLTSYSGWGQMLPAFAEGAAVSNHAHSGLTTESFRSENHWAVMQPKVKPGDWVLMQFGHNDQKLAHLQADTGYAENLRAYVKQLRSMGAVPVLVTPLARNTWFDTSRYNDLLEAHSAAVFAVGKELKVPVIDLHGFAMSFIKRGGMEPSKIYFYPGDWTHTNDHGAYLMASYVAYELGKLTESKGVTMRMLPDWLPDENADRTVPPKALIAVQADVVPAKKTNLPDEIEEPEAPLNRADAFDMVVKACNFFGINVYNDHYDDVTGHETWAGMIEAAVMNGLIPPEMVEGKLIHPMQSVQPYELAAILIRGAMARMAKWQADQADDSIPAWAAEAVGMLMTKQLWKNEWNHAAEITRGEALTLCRRLMS